MWAEKRVFNNGGESAKKEGELAYSTHPPTGEFLPHIDSSWGRYFYVKSLSGETFSYADVCRPGEIFPGTVPL